MMLTYVKLNDQILSELFAMNVAGFRRAVHGELPGYWYQGSKPRFTELPLFSLSLPDLMPFVAKHIDHFVWSPRGNECRIVPLRGEPIEYVGVDLPRALCAAMLEITATPITGTAGISVRTRQALSV